MKLKRKLMPVKRPMLLLWTYLRPQRGLAALALLLAAISQVLQLKFQEFENLRSGETLSMLQ